MAEWLGARLHIGRPVGSVPRRASYCSGSRPNVFLLLFTRLNVHTIVVHDSFCCSVVSVEQEQQKNGRTFRCSRSGVMREWCNEGVV